MRVRNEDRGFWMSEVLVSLWVVAFVGAAILGLFVYLTKSSKIANERASAVLLADRVLDQAVAVGPPFWGLPEGQLGQLQELPLDENGTKPSYRLSVTPLKEHRLGKLFVLDVTVYWTLTPGTVTGVERGRGELSVEKAVYIEDLEEEPEGG